MSTKKFNWYARRSDNQKVKIDRKEEKKIKLDPEIFGEHTQEDESNILALPSKKRKTKVVDEEVKKKKVLTKKQRKNLEKIVERKEKKSKRADLLQKIASVQASEDVMKRLISTTDMQTNKETKQEVDEDLQPSNKVASIFGDASGKKFKKLNARIWKEKEEEEDDIDTDEISTDEDMENEEVGKNLNDEMKEQLNKEFAEATTNESHPHKTSDHHKPNNEDTQPHNNPSEEATQKQPPDEQLRVLPPDVQHPTSRPTIHVPVHRPSHIESERKKLPIYGEEQAIMELISENDVVVLCGETGSGKTTQVPQFLYEAAYAQGKGIIGVTEPRRVAAVCMAERVATEMNLTKKEVSYQIRYEGTAGEETRIKFMTDGVLMKEVQMDFELSKYSVLILDEAHERSVYTDILLGFLSRIVRLRRKRGNPLKLVVMSATLRVGDFTHNTRLFPSPPPVFKVDARQFPVSIHFNKTTPSDYMQEAYKKVCQIHRRLPEGGVLVFVTSQQEVHLLCSKLKKTFPKRVGGSDDGEKEAKKEKRSSLKKSNEKKEVEETGDILLDSLPDIKLENYSAFPMDEDHEDDEEDEEDDDLYPRINDDDSEDGDDDGPVKTDPSKPMHVLPLFSLLPAHKQALVFEAPPSGHRLVVVATNVAETSITIPHVKYVVDTGKVKSKLYDPVTGVSSFKVTSISQASANQRSGRAGRTAPGHCYRLYSSAVFTDFEEFTAPEVLRRPVEDVVLQLKDIGVDKVKNFPFPTPPPVETIEAAEKLLYRLGALEKKKSSKAKNQTYTLTDLGRTIAAFPLNPRYSKMLALGHQRVHLLPYIVAMVAGLSVQEVFVDALDGQEHEGTKEGFKAKRRKLLKKGEQLMLGDVALIIKVICLFEKSCNPGEASMGDGGVRFCEEYGVRMKAMLEVRKLRKQLTNLLNSFLNLDLHFDSSLPTPTSDQCRLLRQLMVAGMVDRVARRLPDPVGVGVEEAKKKKDAYEDMWLQENVFIHPSSILHSSKHQYIVYQHIQQTSKLYMKGITVIEPEWLVSFNSSHVMFSGDDVVDDVTYDKHSGKVMCLMDAKFGPQFWQLPRVKGVLPKSINSSRWFARFLLEGEVIESLKPFCKLLLSPPSTMLKSWAHLQPRTTHLLQALFNRNISSKGDLIAVWRSKPQYLLSEFQEWLPASQHSTLASLWPPIQH